MGTTTVDEQTASKELRTLRNVAAQLSDLNYVGGLLHWDEKVKMPRNGGESRARLKGLIASIHHEKNISPELEAAITAVEDSDPDNIEAKRMRRDFELSTKLPTEHVRHFTEVVSRASQVWERSREDNDFASFAPWLEQVVELSRKTADYFGYETEAYDALHDLYEEGSKAAELEPMFEQLRETANRLIAQQPEADTHVLERRFPVDKQKEVGHHFAEVIGFDFKSGRLDETVHPFCCPTGRHDIRLTTRYDEHWLPNSLFSTLHEAGHGIYEQQIHLANLPDTLNDAPGLGMHESQSRMYENVICRSREFWQSHYTYLQQEFPKSLDDCDVDIFYRQINAVKRSLIRTEADELTYDLHLGVRFELERALINGDLKVSELQEAWNAAYEKWVGIRPQNDREGVLQDTHWGSGLFGYFPTYSLGNVYSAQFVEKATQDLGDWTGILLSGDITPIRQWFYDNIYCHGARYTGRELVEKVTGRPADAGALARYLERKFGSTSS